MGLLMTMMSANWAPNQAAPAEQMCAGQSGLGKITELIKSPDPGAAAANDAHISCRKGALALAPPLPLLLFDLHGD